MFALRRSSGFGMVEFLAVTVAVALLVGVVVVYCARHQSASAGPEVTAVTPPRAAAAGTTSLQSYAVPSRTETRSSL
ncbi:MAG: hypothetical protein FJX75_20425 [Armatimonadetes bacterium]|nr:hypothetical protein [Armatimonadota bacterium]